MSDELYMLVLLGEHLQAMTVHELVGAAMGILGTALIALKTRWVGLGFVAYLVSNLALIQFFQDRGHMALLLMQAVFTVFSLVGIWQWLLAPGWERLGEWMDSKIPWGDEE
jgi:nicotinamide riboside transporter PnuC